MKKLRLLLLVLVLCLMTACSSAGRDDDDDDSSSGRKSKKQQEQVDDEDEDESKEKKKKNKDKDKDKDGDEDKPAASAMPSAEELINGISESFKDEADKYADMNMKLILDANLDAAAMGGPSGTTMAMKISADINMVGGEDAMHMSGSMVAEVLGMQIEQKMDEYKILDGDMYQVYEYDSDRDTWSAHKESKDSDDKNLSSTMTNLPADYFENLAVKEEGSSYVVTGSIPYSKMADSMEGLDSLTMGTGDALEDCYYDVTMKFEKDSRMIQSMELAVNNIVAEGVEFKEFTIALIVNQVGGNVKAVTVPDSVISAAGDIGGDDDDDGDYGDYGDYGGQDEKTPLNIASTGTYDANSFMQKFQSVTGAKSSDWHVYNSDYGYTSVDCSIYGDSSDWYLNFELSVYDDANNDEWFTSKHEFESMGGENYKDYLTQHEADGNEVVGRAGDNFAAWRVDGGDYDLYYVFHDGNTILKVSGHVYNWDDSVSSEDLAEEMVAKLEEVTMKLGLVPAE